ncbi:MAG: radical SAM protein [Candidatus Omnitrophica bacterium]|nr:radical SAM protein [Candidatus Omnitrophota bacterium]
MDYADTVRFTWNIHYKCNFRCPYCFFEGKWEEYGKRSVYLPVDGWMRHWNRIHKLYGPPVIIITGGEPFLYPDFIELIKRLSEISAHINISTNASGDLEGFIRHIDPGKVSLSLSFQPEFEHLDHFLKKVLFVRGSGFDGCINFVAYPPYIKDIPAHIERFNSIGQQLKIIPFWGVYEGREYPHSYSEDEKRIVGADEQWLQKVRRKGSICPAGRKAALIFPDGKVARCGQIGERDLIGSFFDDDFTLHDRPLPCDAEYCPCDEGAVMPEEEERKIEIKSGGASEMSAEQNTRLNDEEYNGRKTRLQSSPTAIFVQAANTCNSSCVFCSRGHGYDMFDLEAHKARFNHSFYPFLRRAQRIIMTGSGEFLQLPNSLDILDYFDNAFPDCEKMFSTNGSSLVQPVCDKIIASKSPYTIHVSLHSSNKKLHSALTRMDNFYRIVSQVNYILRQRQERHKDNLRVKLIFVATTLNIEDLPDFVRLAKQVGADEVVCYYNYIYVHAQKYLSCFFKQEFTNRMLDEAGALAAKLGVAISLPPKFNQSSYPDTGVCREPWSQLMLDAAGHVLPCDASEDCGLVLEEGRSFMDDIWNSPYYIGLREKLIDGRASCAKHCFRANPAAVNDFKSHVIHRGVKENIDICWGDNF